MDRTTREFALFKKFVESGYERKKFTQDLYRALHFSFGFIAHYDIDGFYAERFAGWERRANTFAQILERRGAPTPFEEAVRAFVVGENLFALAKSAAALELERVERAELARLKAKYEDGRSP
jgi:hypothetical protein